MQLSYAQNDWQEHLSHDRTAYAHHGHFIHGGLLLMMGNHTSPMNTTEKIYGNQKKGIFWESANLNSTTDMNEYLYQSTRLGEEQSQVTLKAPLNYNILGNGVHSIIQTGPPNVSLRKIENPIVHSLNIQDIIFPLSQFEGIYFITDESKLYSLDFGHAINWVEDYEGDLKLHNGLNSKAYKIHDGVFSNIENPSQGSVFLGEYEKLDNNPFKNQLIEFEQTTVNRYSFLDFSLTRTDDVIGQPIDHLFVEDGFYYMTESDLNYTIYFFSDESSQSEVYYELPKSEEIIDFEINEFNIKGNEVFFLGLWKAPHIKEKFSYVQRRNINQEYEPIRKNLEFTNMTVIPNATGQDDQFEYEYTCTVTNLSDDPINYFTLYSERLDLFDNVSDQFIKNDISQELAPGESFEITGEFTYSSLNSITFHIAGVDFGIDSEMSNNSYTVNFGSVSSKEILSNEFTIAPNPTSNYISISGDIKDIVSISIIDIIGNKYDIKTYNSNRIDTSNLPTGQYWLQIKTKANTELQTFIKY